jgi:hypothetical protein
MKMPMQSTRQILADLLWPIRPGTPGQDSNAHLRPLIALAIVLYCGPEVFAAADLILLLDLLGVTLFLTAFNAGFRAIVFEALARVRGILFPVEWAALIRIRNPAPVVTHGLVLIGFNALITSAYCLITLVGLIEVAKAAI